MGLREARVFLWFILPVEVFSIIGSSTKLIVHKHWTFGLSWWFFLSSKSSSSEGTTKHIVQIQRNRKIKKENIIIMPSCKLQEREQHPVYIPRQGRSHILRCTRPALLQFLYSCPLRSHLRRWDEIVLASQGSAAMWTVQRQLAFAPSKIEHYTQRTARRSRWR